MRLQRRLHVIWQTAYSDDARTRNLKSALQPSHDCKYMYMKWQDNATNNKAPVAVPDCYLSASCVQFVFLKKPFSKKSGWLLTGCVPGQLRFGRAPSEITAVISRNNKPINLPGRGCETGHLFMHVALTEKWKLKSLSTHLCADWKVEWSCSFLLNSWSRRETFSNV